MSFEPLSSPYMELEAAARADGLWGTLNVGLGDAEQDATINIAGNSFSSSLYQMLLSHIGAAPESKYIGQERIYIKTLDSIFDSHYSKDQNALLKIDVQGFEEKVIAGEKNSLPLIDTIQLEMSLMPLYDGELLFDEMFPLLHEKGYRMVAIEPGFTDKQTGRMLQVDGIFHRY